MSIKLYYNYNSYLFLMVASGEMDFTNLKEALIQMFNSKILRSVKFGMVDFRNARFSFSTEELDTLIAITMDYQSILPRANWSILTASPHETALAYLYKVQSKHLNSDIQVFSTVQAGLKFMEISEEEFHKTINSPPFFSTTDN